MENQTSRQKEWTKLAVEKYLDMVYRLAYARTGSRQDAEDISQNVMLKLVIHAAEIESEQHLKHWLIRVTVNESIGLFRSAWRRLTTPMDLSRLPEKAHTKDNTALDEALSALSPKLRVVVHLYYYEDMTTAKIAETLKVKPDAVRERLHRARKKLRQQLTERGGDVFV